MVSLKSLAPVSLVLLDRKDAFIVGFKGALSHC